jgi:hypothetical protein
MAQYKNLIITEDLHTCCLLNTGVFALRVCEWSLELLQEVWSTTKYDSVFYYEQSALVKVLQTRKEGLNKIKPFHSFLPGAPKDVKLFPNVAVFPHSLFSTNSVLTLAELEQVFGSKAREEEKDMLITDNNNSPEMIPFIYHAAGVKNKLGHIRAVLEKFHFPVPEELGLEGMNFRLLRNNLGHYLGENHPVLKYKREQEKKKKIITQEEGGKELKLKLIGENERK